jgi:hypothetical protein
MLLPRRPRYRPGPSHDKAEVDTGRSVAVEAPELLVGDVRECFRHFRLRLACGQPQTVRFEGSNPAGRPSRSSWTWCSAPSGARQSTPTTLAGPSPRLSASVGLVAHPHMLRHALASAMAANKEPASIIAAQLRHANGGALAQRMYIHQLPQTAPRLAGVIEGVFGPAARDRRAVSAGRRAEGNWRETRPPNPP